MRSLKTNERVPSGLGYPVERKTPFREETGYAGARRWTSVNVSSQSKRVGAVLPTYRFRSY